MELQNQRFIKNKRENQVQKKYEQLGYSYLKKGWPDFLFVKDGQLIMVEVKRKQKKPSKKMGLSRHQENMRTILSEHFQYIVEYVD